MATCTAAIAWCNYAVLYSGLSIEDEYVTGLQLGSAGCREDNVVLFWMSEYVTCLGVRTDGWIVWICPSGMHHCRHKYPAIITQTTSYPLNQANQALADLRAGRFEGAAVLVP